jgi:hypothetical protein
VRTQENPWDVCNSFAFVRNHSKANSPCSFRLSDVFQVALGPCGLQANIFLDHSRHRLLAGSRHVMQQTRLHQEDMVKFAVRGKVPLRGKEFLLMCEYEVTLVPDHAKAGLLRRSDLCARLGTVL